MDADELAGRSDVLAVLSEAVNATADRPDAILLVGEAGIGKTTCLLAVATMASAAGHQVLETAGSEAERNLPYAGLHRMLRPLLGAAKGLPTVQHRALLAALGMGQRGPKDAFLVSVAALNLIRNGASDTSLLIIADDAQWLDDETRGVLAFVARRLDRGHASVVAASSSPQRLPDLRDAFRELKLDRLNDSAARCLLANRAPELDKEQRDRVLRHAVGNPLALVELAKTVASVDSWQPNPISPAVALTPVLERAFAGRWPELSSLSRDAVLVASLDAASTLQEILAAAGLLSNRDVTSAALEVPLSLGVLSFDETGVYFSHPLVMTAIAQRESITRRQAAHRALGAVITLSSSRRAWHRALGAGEHDEAIAAELEATTGGSIRRGETALAIMALERAAQLSAVPVDRGRRLISAARLAARLGQLDAVDRLLGGALAGELSAFDRVRADLLGATFGGIVIGDSNRVIQLCGVAQQAAAAGETELAIELADAAARRRCAAPIDAAALSQLASLAQSLAGESSDARAVAALALADPIGHGRAVLSTLADLEEATVSDADQLYAYGLAARAVGYYSAAARLLDRAEAAFRPRGLLGPLSRALCVLADLHLELGEWDRAEAALNGFASMPAACVPASHRATVLATTAKIAALRGNIAAALELVSEAEHSPSARSGSSQLARAQIIRGIVCISAHKHVDAYAALRRVFDPDDPSHHFREQFDALGYLAEAAVHTGQQADATDVVERMQLIADVSESPVLLMHLAYARAVLAPDTAAEQLFLACLAADAASSPWQRARTQLAYGSWLRRQQRVTQSRGPLQASLETLQRIGAAGWAEEARAELAASGANIDSSADDSVLSLLSTQESKIARLVAEGLSNRQIGQQLNLSPRTVSSHLYRIFPKLGISSRGQIASRLAESYAVS